MRLFVGIPLADKAVHELAVVVSRLREARGARVGGTRWSDPDSWHITLQFLGSATQEQLRCVAAMLGKVRSTAVPIQVGELGSFERAGVLFADVTATPQLAALQQRVVTATGECGFAAEERPFHPHVTLARKTENRENGNKERGAALGELAASARNQPAFTRFTSREFLLYESHTRPEGAQYEVRARFELLDP